VFPNEKRELLAGSTENRRAGRRDAQKGGPAEKGGPEGCRFLQPAPPFSAGPPFCASRRPALLSSVLPAKSSRFSFGNKAL